MKVPTSGAFLFYLTTTFDLESPDAPSSLLILVHPVR
jgi:hypothetical protein